VTHLKKRFLIVSLLLLAVTLFSCCPVNAAAIQNLSAVIDASGQVTVTGNIDSGPGKNVTICITDPNAKPYVNQVTSGENGSFIFSYKITTPAAGIYNVSVGGEEVAVPVTTTFTYPPETPNVQIINLDASIDTTGLVTVEGNLTSGANQNVTLCIVDPSNKPYNDQKTTGDNGYFKFSYTITNPATGTYTVYVGGDGISTPVVKTFEYTAVPAPEVTNLIASVNTQTKVVTVTGSFGTTADKKVGIAITDPQSNVLNGEATTQANGYFEYTCTLTNPPSGTYQVSVNGAGLVTPAQTSFEYTPAEGCFIATAAFGSYLDPHVWVLRQFRDNVLLKSAFGSWFVAEYYRHSPPIAAVIAAHPTLRLITRIFLTPIIYGVEYPLAAAAILMLIAAFIVIRKMRREVLIA
jgi:hypothetical protein